MKQITEVYFQNLSDKACVCGGLLKFFEILSTVKGFLCVEDQGRESRLFFPEFPFAPAQAPTTAPTTFSTTGLTTVSTTASTAASTTAPATASTQVPSQSCKCGVPLGNRNKIVGGQAANKVGDQIKWVKVMLHLTSSRMSIPGRWR